MSRLLVYLLTLASVDCMKAIQGTRRYSREVPTAMDEQPSSRGLGDSDAAHGTGWAGSDPYEDGKHGGIITTRVYLPFMTVRRVAYRHSPAYISPVYQLDHMGGVHRVPWGRPLGRPRHARGHRTRPLCVWILTDKL